jgi:hypothetical protein
MITFCRLSAVTMPAACGKVRASRSGKGWNEHRLFLLKTPAGNEEEPEV